MNRPIKLLSMVWGDHLELFEKVCLRSLFQSHNLPEVLSQGRKVEMFIMTPERDRDDALARLAKVSQDYPIDCSWFEGCRLVDGLIACMSKCIEDNSLLMLTPPDTFFADGSISNLLAYHADRKDMCVSGFHVRVNDKEFLQWLEWKRDLSDVWYNLSSDKLVDAAFDFAHPSFKHALIDESINNARHGGVYVQKIRDGLWSIVHRLPTVYLASVNDEDLKRFSERRKFDEWDWSWPAKLMLKKRYKCCASSDLFFAVELTPVDKNVPLLVKNDKLIDDFSLRDYHFDFQKFVVGTLRGTERSKS